MARFLLLAGLLVAGASAPIGASAQAYASYANCFGTTNPTYYWSWGDWNFTQGDTIDFVNFVVHSSDENCDTVHSVTSDDGHSFNSGPIQPGADWVLNINLPDGAYPFHDLYHDLTGTLNVNVPRAYATDPEWGPRQGGESITLYGDNFQPGIRMYQGTSENPLAFPMTGVNLVDSQQVQAVTPAVPGDGYSYDVVTVVNPNGQASSSYTRFWTYGRRYADVAGQGEVLLATSTPDFIAHLYCDPYIFPLTAQETTQGSVMLLSYPYSGQGLVLAAQGAFHLDSTAFNFAEARQTGGNCADAAYSLRSP
ncbi:MAG: IPT/TIG domain-containing protein [Candidatus Dormibacteria bacterium]